MHPRQPAGPRFRRFAWVTHSTFSESLGEQEIFTFRRKNHVGCSGIAKLQLVKVAQFPTPQPFLRTNGELPEKVSKPIVSKRLRALPLNFPMRQWPMREQAAEPRSSASAKAARDCDGLVMTQRLKKHVEYSDNGEVVKARIFRGTNASSWKFGHVIYV
jgi:hypothetical protein